MNARQARALLLMREHRNRDLYEGASAANSRAGSGEFWITHTSGEGYDPLTKRDVDELVTDGLIKEKWPGCYELASAHPSRQD